MSPEPVKAVSGSAALCCFLITLTAYCVWIPQFLRHSSPPTGDQPFYLMDVASLAQDGDLDVRNNYDESDFDKFYKLAPRPDGFDGMSAPYPLARQIIPTPARPPQEQYSFHLPGLPLLLVPSWIAGSWLELWWPATIVQMCIIGALVAVNVLLLAAETTGSRGVAWAVWFAMAFSSPLMSHSYVIFSELSSGLLLIYAFRRLALGLSGNGPARCFLIGSCIAYIPWISLRCALLSVMLGTFATFQWWKFRKGRQAGVSGEALRLLGLVPPIVVSLLAMTIYSRLLFGTYVPKTSVPEADAAGAFHFFWGGSDELRRTMEACFGLLFDRNFGLLPDAPVYLLAFAGLAVMARSHRDARGRASWIVLVCVPYLFLLASFNYWNGIWCFPARYLTTLVPLAAAPLAAALAACRGLSGWIYRGLYGVLLVWGMAAIGVMIYDARYLWPVFMDGALGWFDKDPRSPLHLDLLALFPSFIWPDPVRNPFVTGRILGVSVIVVLASVWLLRAARGPGTRVSARAAVTVLCALAALGLAWFALNRELLWRKTVLNELGRWPIVNAPPRSMGIAFLDGQIYIAAYSDEDSGALGAFDLESHRYRPIRPHTQDGPLSWTRPTDVKVTPDRLLAVLNNALERETVLVLSPDGTVRRSVDLIGPGPVSCGLHVGAESELYVSDMVGGSVTRFQPGGGGPFFTWRGVDGILTNPLGVFVDAAGMVYTTETLPRIQQLDATGQVLRRFPVPCAPRYFAVSPKTPEWVEISCSEGMLSLNLKEFYVQRARFQGGQPLGDPFGVAYGPDGTLYVVDSGSMVAYRVEHHPPESDRFWSEPARVPLLPPRPTGPRPMPAVADPSVAPALPLPARRGRRVGAGLGLSSPAGIAVGAAGEIYVADSGNRRIVRLDRSGRLLQVWDEARTRASFGNLTDIDVSGDGRRVAALDAETGLYLFSRDGALETIGTVAPSNANGVHVGPDGMLRVADTSHSHIGFYALDGRFERAWQADPAHPDSRLEQPLDVVSAADGSMFVLDLRRRVVHIAADGRWLSSWPVDALGKLALWQGKVVVSDPERHRLVLIDPGSGRLEETAVVSDDSRAILPQGLATGPQDALYVLDKGNGQIFVLDPS